MGNLFDDDFSSVKLNFFLRILHTAREKRPNEKDRVDYIFIKQEQYEEDVTKVC